MTQTLLITMLISVVRLSIPVIITGLGNMFSEKAGVMNLGAEGMMIFGAFGAVLGAYVTGDPWIGVMCGMLGGVIIGGIHSLISVEFGGIQNISGLGLNMFAAGLTAFLSRAIFGTSMSPSVASIQTTNCLKGIPVVGNILAQFSPIAYLAILLLVICWYLMSKTVAGLRITAVGDDPRTVETAGINVWNIRHICVLLCGAMAGLAGAYLSLGQLNIFMEDMTNGKGMLAVIAVKMGRWDPKRILAVALLFGFFDALQMQLQVSQTLAIAPELIQTIPYLAGIAALVFDTKSGGGPAAMRQPYLKNRYKI